MDKNIWLKVIKQELGLLDQLASGMIEDLNLSKEEVELALTRSKVVVREFEMLLQQIPSGRREAGVPAAPLKGEKATAGVNPLPVVEILPDHEVVVSTEPVVVPVPEPASEPVVVKTEAEPKVASPAPGPVIPPAEKPSVDRESGPEPDILFDEQKDTGSQFKAAPLKSLKEGLSLNDRYLFQRELFDNDKSKLDDTVAALDRLSNIKDAVDYLKSNFRWTKNEASEKFVQLVKRRFS